MLSDVPLGLPGHMLTLTGVDLLVLCVVVLAVAVLAMALNRGRRVELRHSAATDILIVQLERIGDTLDRIVAQNATMVAAFVKQQPQQAVQRAVDPANASQIKETAPAKDDVKDCSQGADSAVAVMRFDPRPAPVAVKPALIQSQPAHSQPPQAQPSAVQAALATSQSKTEPQAAKPALEPDESVLNDPVRSVVYSMLRP